MRMISIAFLGLLSSTLVFSAALAQDFGTAEEARAMLDRATAALEEDKDQALSDFNAGAEGFKEKDLYVFCGNAETGEFTAHGANESLVGKSLQDLQDKDGKALGEEMYSVAAEGEVHEVDYMWPRPGEEEPTQKSSYVTRVDDQICAVGYYQ